jgi:MFS family permease
MVDVGALFGGMLVGHLGDIYQLRALFLSPLLFLGSIVMFIVSQALDEYALPYYFLMCLIGIFTGGPYNVIGSAIAVDLGQQPMLKDTPNAVSIISALV